MTSNETALEVMLAVSGITPLPEDREPMLKAFATGREQAELIFTVQEARYEEPALVFSARV